MNKEKKLGMEPVHPTPHYNEESGHMNGFSNGMSKRFYAACAAMQGILANAHPEIITLNPVQVTDMAYEFADELLKQEEL